MYRVSDTSTDDFQFIKSGLKCTPVVGWLPQLTGGPVQSWPSASCSVHPTWPPLSSSAWSLPSKDSYKQKNYNTCRLSFTIQKVTLCRSVPGERVLRECNHVCSETSVQTNLPTQSTAMPSGVVMYLMPRSTATAMLLLPSSTEGMYALLMAPRAAPWLATVKYTIPDKTQGRHQTSSSGLRFVMILYLTFSECLVLVCVWPTESSVVVVKVVVQSHDMLLFFQEVVEGLRLQVELTDTDVLR